MKRYRVRESDQDWTDEGPDLLRSRENTLVAVRSRMHQRVENWYVRREEQSGWEDWGPPLSKRDALVKIGNWSPNKSGLGFQFGRKDKRIKPDITVQFEEVHYHDISCNDRVEVIWSLAKHQFGNAQMAGGFVCKEYNGVPGSGWSDHAWRDAVDVTPDNNNQLTDWSRRMAQSRNMDFAYLLGSQNGRVGLSSAPDYGWDWGGPESHEWHVHYSVVDHDGRNPGC